MKSFKLLHELLRLVEQFEADGSYLNGTIEEFAGFLLTNLYKETPEVTHADVRFGDRELPAQQRAFVVENAIGRLLVYMSRYAKGYIKKALEGTPLVSAEDFTCLAILLTHDHLTKKELIEYNMQEKTSGTEVIRRLIATGLAEQKDDSTDRRTKNVSITHEGRQLMYRVFNEMNHVGKIISGRLSLDEKLVLQSLLQKLEDFHHRLHDEKAINTKEDLARWAAILG
ncbi:MAG TPA: winged helix DNA-binding protein [Chitinophagaceae bacterium]|nr:winged helix DNA-binding protein [Chitinophagaceae bacterium]